MATTYEKITGAVAALRALDPADAPPDVRDLLEGIQISANLGVDPFAMLIPTDPADADVLIDKTIVLLLQARGDDLPPFNFETAVS